MTSIQRNICRRFLVAFVALSVGATTVAAPLSGTGIPNCPAAGYSVYYVNGVDNTPEDATLSAITLASLALPAALDSSILARTKVRTIYNATDGIPLDLLESAGQVVTGTVTNTSAYLTAAWVGIFGGLFLPIPGLDGVLTKFVDSFRAAVTKVISSASVSKVLNDAVPKIVADLNSGRVVVVIAHSQGNYYANQIYDAVNSQVQPSRMPLLRIVNVASPTSLHISGLYVLNSTDVITGLNKEPITFTPDGISLLSTLSFNRDSFKDMLGHNFVTTYLSSVPGNGTTLLNQIVLAIQTAVSRGLIAAVENCPSGGGFSNVNLTCKRNPDGSALLSGLYTAELLPGEQITAVDWSAQYLSGSTGNCQTPTYAAPTGANLPPGDYSNTNCVPSAGLNLHPVYYATCHNPLSGVPRNIWVTLNSTVPKTYLNSGSVLMMLCRATTANLNSTIPPGARPNVSLDTLIACN
ncbi:hypothetical protein SAMN04487926_1617 [Paraburkholderia steynii]|uniref:Uncharacterized protein n=1 Tax=Paraburkholderia steynii TaxID=1245441 RepID=A0A7Z7BLQ0_9BURK|nr:hypothetical protein [Paraburkholderia steynii]SDJ54346.1 hypothetical protein SAMN04487926_1617 [Paraburkholderia steynii]